MKWVRDRDMLCRMGGVGTCVLLFLLFLVNIVGFNYINIE